LDYQLLRSVTSFVPHFLCLPLPSVLRLPLSFFAHSLLFPAIFRFLNIEYVIFCSLPRVKSRCTVSRGDLLSRSSARGGLLLGEEPCKRRLVRGESTDESGRRWKKGEIGSNVYFGSEYQRADTKFSKSIKRPKPSF
jgi:hypothetical protein